MTERARATFTIMSITTRFGRLCSIRYTRVALCSRYMIRTIMTESSLGRLEALFPRPNHPHCDGPRRATDAAEETDRALIHGLSTYHVERDPFTNERGFHSFVMLPKSTDPMLILVLQPCVTSPSCGVRDGSQVFNARQSGSPARTADPNGTM